MRDIYGTNNAALHFQIQEGVMIEFQNSNSEELDVVLGGLQPYQGVSNNHLSNGK